MNKSGKKSGVSRTKRFEGLSKEIGAKERRKIKSRREGRRGVWFGLGMFGLVGWSIAIPTLLGVALGRFIDKRWPSHVSWTLTFLLLGVAFGCANAWYWVKRELKK